MSLHTAHFLTSLCYPVVTSNTSPALSAGLPKPFFGDVIGGWTVEPNQSFSNNSTTNYPGVAEGSPFRYSDLQVAKVTLTTTDGVTTGSSTMEHRMGLVELVPTAKAVTKTLTWNFNKNDGSYTESKSGTNDGSVTASTAFTDNKPLTVNDRYWYVVKSTSTSENTAVSFTCDEEQTDYWSAKSSGTDVGYGKYKSISIQSDRTAQNLIALFSCQKTCQTITLPWYGSYKMECWGAQGGARPQSSGSATPGNGGYVSGTITLGKIELYVYVGEQGTSAYKRDNNRGGWNGGGYGGSNKNNTYDDAGSGGGGSTDIRIVKHSNGEWGYSSSAGADNSYKSRIIVAAGGGGCCSPTNVSPNTASGGSGGGLNGYSGSGSHTYTAGVGAKQNSGGTGQGGLGGSFGYASQIVLTGTQSYGGGGAGGWYGGAKGYGAGGTGGSSFISGHGGCNGFNNTTNAHTGTGNPSVINGKTYTFGSTAEVYDGNGYKWNNTAATSTRGFSTTSGSGTENGHSGNGYAKITSQ